MLQWSDERCSVVFKQKSCNAADSLHTKHNSYERMVEKTLYITITEDNWLYYKPLVIGIFHLPTLTSTTHHAQFSQVVSSVRFSDQTFCMYFHHFLLVLQFPPPITVAIKQPNHLSQTTLNHGRILQISLRTESQNKLCYYDSLELSSVKEVVTAQGSVWFHVMVKVCTVPTLKCCYHAGSEQTIFRPQN
jgi:hypothetical protein